MQGPRQNLITDARIGPGGCRSRTHALTERHCLPSVFLRASLPPLKPKLLAADGMGEIEQTGIVVKHGGWRFRPAGRGSAFACPVSAGSMVTGSGHYT